MPKPTILSSRAMTPRCLVATTYTLMRTICMAGQWVNISPPAAFGGWMTASSWQKLSQSNQLTTPRATYWRWTWSTPKTYTTRTMHIRWHRSAWWFRRPSDYQHDLLGVGAAPTDVWEAGPKPPQQGPLCAPLSQSAAVHVSGHASDWGPSCPPIRPKTLDGAIHPDEYWAPEKGRQRLREGPLQVDEQLGLREDHGEPAEAGWCEAGAFAWGGQTQAPHRQPSICSGQYLRRRLGGYPGPQEPPSAQSPGVRNFFLPRVRVRNSFYWALCWLLRLCVRLLVLLLRLRHRLF